MRQMESQARIVLNDPDRVLGELCRHMVEHDADLEEADGLRTLRFKNSIASFRQDGATTVIAIRSTDLEGIYFTRLAVASHITEFAADTIPRIIWQGDGGDLIRPPNFQVVEVRAIEDITPRMRRLTLAGEDVARFLPLDALHLNILIQKPGVSEPQWPSVGPDGMIHWANPDLRPDFRKYTVRSINTKAGTIDIDFVLHADAGPGSALAEQARIGDRFGIAGPGGGGLIEADWYLFAGDETALPAIARMLEALPETVTGKAFIEVACENEIQNLVHPEGIKVIWLMRDQSNPGANSPLVDAVRSINFPRDGRRIYVWSGCEFEDFRSIRAYLRQDVRLRKQEHLAVSYWRRGSSEA